MIRMDMTAWPQCTNQGCGIDSSGAYHGIDCARSRFAAEQLEAWQGEN